MSDWSAEHERAQRKRAESEPHVAEFGEAVGRSLDVGKRERRAHRGPLEGEGDGSDGEYRKRSPTRSERMNRALDELGTAAFKIHALLWQWRGAPARGNLPYFTIRSLEKFCNLTRPTVRKALQELVHKGWIKRGEHNIHFKNALFRLVPVRQIPRPGEECRHVM